MSVKEIVRKQYVRAVDRAASQLQHLKTPPIGWLRLFRDALGMSASQVAKRMGITRNAIYQAERNELDGAITLNQMDKLAKAMGGRFVYAIIPNGTVDDIVSEQAYRKAKEHVGRASAHMALESQSLPGKEIMQKIDELAQQYKRDRPSNFWTNN